MKRKSRVGSVICHRCGGAVDPATGSCIVCRAAVLAMPSPTKAQREHGFVNIFFSSLASVLLVVAAALYVLMLFLHALCKNTIIPGIDGISGDWLNSIFDSWYPIAVGGALLLLFVLVIAMINTRCMQRAFLAFGISAVIAAIVDVLLAVFGSRIIKMLSGEWQDALVNATAAFGEFSILCAILLLMIGAACLSVYFCIVAVKGAKYEKDA